MRRYRFIQREQAVHPITLPCRVLGIARSADDAWARRGVSARARAEAELAAQIAAAHAQGRGTCGAPRVHAVLHAAGVRTSRRRVARLMRAGGLVGRHRRRRTRTTVADPTSLPAPNLVARDFAAPVPNRLWLGDITDGPTGAGWLSLAALLDAHSRRVVGWAMADHLRTALALDALAMALSARRPPPGLIHHTDRGRYGIACQAPWPAKPLRPRSSGQFGQDLVLLLLMIRVEALECAAERPGLVQQLPGGGAAGDLLRLARRA